MKFVINTSLDPHFCALFSDENILIEKSQWTKKSKDGAEIYKFLSKYDSRLITFCGAVSGPGGFASLRASACVITSISCANSIDIHQISAEKLMQIALGNDSFLLNSFGRSIWKMTDGKIDRIDVDIIDKNMSYFVDVLPDDKASLFPHKIQNSLLNLEKVLLNSLIDEKPRKTFVPHYEFPPV